MHTDEYRLQAKALYRETEAYKEFAQKSKHRTHEQELGLGAQVMDYFVRLGALRPCPPDSPQAITWAQALRDFFTEHYYNCTPEIFRCLAESYAAGGSMTENIDQAAGAGTGEFAKQVIEAYLAGL